MVQLPKPWYTLLSNYTLMNLSIPLLFFQELKNPKISSTFADLERSADMLQPNLRLNCPPF